MRAYSNEVTRPFETSRRATRWNWKRRRMRFRLRNLGRAVASRMTGIWTGCLIEALHDSRSQLASRVIRQHRHLLQDDYCAGETHCADDEGPETRPPDFTER